MACSIGDRLSAYHDGELDSASAAEVRNHIEYCPECAAALADLARMSNLFEPTARPHLSQMGLYRMHAAADSAIYGSVLRTARALRAVAACVLVGASLWMMQSPASPVAQEASNVQEAAATAPPPWMDVAVTVSADTNSLDATTPAAAWYLASVTSRSDDLP